MDTLFKKLTIIDALEIIELEKHTHVFIVPLLK